MKENFFASNANKWSDKIMHRTEAFFDAVIAIAMTMIALEISLPDIEIFDYTAFKTICQEITIYFISFIALASIWTVHAWIYAAYDCLGKPLDIFINIILLFFVTLFPIFTKLLKKYANDPSAFPLLYQEMVASLPLAIQRKITDREQKQRTQKTMLILFFTISFFAVTASVLSMMWNPYLSYIFSTVGIIVFIICSIILRHKERGC